MTTDEYRRQQAEFEQMIDDYEEQDHAELVEFLDTLDDS